MPFEQCIKSSIDVTSSATFKDTSKTNFQQGCAYYCQNTFGIDATTRYSATTAGSAAILTAAGLATNMIAVCFTQDNVQQCGCGQRVTPVADACTTSTNDDCPYSQMYESVDGVTD